MEVYGLHVHEDEAEAVTLREVDVFKFGKGFLLETTLQGIPNLVRHRGLVKKMFWLCCLGGCAYGMYWQLNKFYTDLFEWSPATSITVTQPRSIYFPAVTICNSNPVNLDWFNKNTGTSSAWTNGTSGNGSGRKKRQAMSSPGSKSSLSLSAHEGGSSGAMSSVTCGSLANIYSAMTTVYTKLNDSTMYKAGHRLCDHVLSCTYNGKMCTVEKAFSNSFWNPTYGNCWTFNHGYSQYVADGETDLWTVKLGDDASGVLKATQLGKGYGLYLLLNVDLEEYLSTSASIGWRVLVHNQTVMPFPEMEGVYISPGTSTQIQIKTSYLSKLSTVDNGIYTANYSSCNEDNIWDPTDSRNAYAHRMEVGYTREACLKTCYQKNVMKNCSCYDFKVPHTGAAFANIAGSSSMGPCAYGNDVQWNCKEGVWKKYATEDVKCYCVNSCLTYSYDVSVSSKKWPVPRKENIVLICDQIFELLNATVNGSSTCTSSLLREKYLANTPIKEISELAQSCVSWANTSSYSDYDWQATAANVVGKRFAEVYIYFKTFDYTAVIESEKYGIADIFAYLGGIIGLFCGFTVFTLAEYILVMIDFIIIGIAKLYYNFVEQKPPINTVGAVSAVTGNNSKGYNAMSRPSLEARKSSANKDYFGPPPTSGSSGAHHRSSLYANSPLSPTPSLPPVYPGMTETPLPPYQQTGNPKAQAYFSQY